jgi:putative ABC transport system permease protein
VIHDLPIPRSAAPFSKVHEEHMSTHFLSDSRHACRALLRRPGFVTVTVLTLALGIGATTAVFTVLNSVVLRPLPFDHPERLVRIYEGSDDTPPASSYASGADFLDFREALSAVAAVAALYDYREYGVTLTTSGAARRLTALPVSAGFFEVYGVRPVIGRTFSTEDEDPAARTAVLSGRLWRALWNGDPAAVGRRLELDGVSWTVIGVMPEWFHAPVGGDVDLWVPQDCRTAEYVSPVTSTVWNSRSNSYLSVIGRLADGVSLARAQSRLTILMHGLAEQYPGSNGHKIARMVPLYDDVVGGSRTMLAVLMGAAGLVLLLACVNVATVYVARNLGRERELAVRSALGSSRARLVQRLLVECLLVAVAGGGAGLALAFWGVKAVVGLMPGSLPRATEIAPDATVLVFAAAVTVLTVLVFGLAPALKFAAPDIEQCLRGTSRAATGGRRITSTRNLLVASQVTLAVMLVIGAGLLMRSFAKLQAVDLGIAPQHVTTLEVHLPDAWYPDAASQVAFHQALDDRLAQVPGVTAVGAVSRLPITGRYNSWGYRYNDADGNRTWGNADFRIIEGDYFQALNVRLVAGRQFDRTDGPASQPVAIVNQAAATATFADADPLGREIEVDGIPRRIVGVVQNVAYDPQGDIAPKVYLPHAQYVDRNWNLTHVVATSTERPDLPRILRRELAALDPNLVLHNGRPWKEIAGAAIAGRRFTLLLMTVFGTVAIALAAVGIYGVLAYSVQQRTREIGIRMALGADRRMVRWSVVRHGAVLAGIGIAAGLLGAAALSRILASMVFQVSVRDPITFVVAPLALVLAALAAGYVPARRATSVDPVEAIRGE